MSVLAFVILLTVVGIVLGVVFGVASTPKFATATPWWRHGLIYQLNVPTFANDVEGVIGRLKDATTRMAYLSKRVGIHSHFRLLFRYIYSNRKDFPFDRFCDNQGHFCS
ncbi:unnamed protein product [Dibothriocephalus latus]|uniref:Uncharacterized protein n=1 Tax=Dibothriocephalus latus TaxID=60516 RepID=A0A3P7NMJ3_DIBLA|nr:unnamed protein product [Dibothriocephalus latus]